MEGGAKTLLTDVAEMIQNFYRPDVNVVDFNLLRAILLILGRALQLLQRQILVNVSSTTLRSKVTAHPMTISEVKIIGKEKSKSPKHSTRETTERRSDVIHLLSDVMVGPKSQIRKPDEHKKDVSSKVLIVTYSDDAYASTESGDENETPLLSIASQSEFLRLKENVLTLESRATSSGLSPWLYPVGIEDEDPEICKLAERIDILDEKVSSTQRLLDLLHEKLRTQKLAQDGGFRVTGGLKVGSDGEVLGPDGNPVPGGFKIGKDGTILQPNGKPMPGGLKLGPGGVISGPDGKKLPEGVVLGPGGIILEQDKKGGDKFGLDEQAYQDNAMHGTGVIILDKETKQFQENVPPKPAGFKVDELNGELLGPDGNPVQGAPKVGPDGLLLGPDDNPLPSGLKFEDGKLIGPNGVPVQAGFHTGTKKELMGPTGKQVPGQLIVQTKDGTITGKDGNPVSGNLKLGTGGVILGPDNKLLPGDIKLGPFGMIVLRDGVEMAGGLSVDQDGTLLGQDGKPVKDEFKIARDGAVLDNTGNKVPGGLKLRADGTLVKEDGVPIPSGFGVGDRGELLAPDGKPYPGKLNVAPDGFLIKDKKHLPNEIKIGLGGTLLGADAIPIQGKFKKGPNNELLGPDDRPLEEGFTIAPGGLLFDAANKQFPGIKLGPGGILLRMDGIPIQGGFRVGKNGDLLTPSGEILPGGIKVKPKLSSELFRQLTTLEGEHIQSLSLAPFGIIYIENKVPVLNGITVGSRGEVCGPNGPILDMSKYLTHGDVRLRSHVFVKEIKLLTAPDSSAAEKPNSCREREPHHWLPTDDTVKGPFTTGPEGLQKAATVLTKLLLNLKFLNVPIPSNAWDSLKLVEDKVAAYVKKINFFDEEYSVLLTNSQENLTEMLELIHKAIDNMQEAISSRVSDTEGLEELHRKFNVFEQERTTTDIMHQALEEEMNLFGADLENLTKRKDEIANSKCNKEFVENMLQNKASVAQVNGILEDQYYKVVADDIVRKITVIFDKASSTEFAWQNLIKNLLWQMMNKAEPLQIEFFLEDVICNTDAIEHKLNELYAYAGFAKPSKIKNRSLFQEQACVSCSRNVAKVKEESVDKDKKSNTKNELDLTIEGLQAKICYPSRPIPHPLDLRANKCSRICGGRTVRSDTENLESHVKTQQMSTSKSTPKIKFEMVPCIPCNLDPTQAVISAEKLTNPTDESGACKENTPSDEVIIIQNTEPATIELE